MNTLRVCATFGLGLSLALGSGCSSDSTSGKKDGGPGGPDVRRADGPTTNPNPNTDGPTNCSVGGQTYRPNERFTIDCVNYVCQGGNNVTSTGGTSCSDGPIRDVASTSDLPTNRDTPFADAGRVDAAPPVDVGGAKDTQPSDAGPVKDVGTKDTRVADVFVPLDTVPAEPDLAEPDLAVSEDTAPPEPDLPVQDDVSVPVYCTPAAGQTYQALPPCQGVPFACGTKMCECDLVGSGAVIVTIPDTCAVDAQ